MWEICTLCILGNSPHDWQILAWQKREVEEDWEWVKKACYQLVTTIKTHCIKNVSGTSHWFTFSWTNSVAIRNYRNETTCTYGQIKFLTGIAITGMYTGHVRLMWLTSLTLIFRRVNEREEDQINVAILQVTDPPLFCRNCLKYNNGKPIVWELQVLGHKDLLQICSGLISVVDSKGKCWSPNGCSFS